MRAVFAMSFAAVRFDFSGYTLDARALEVEEVVHAPAFVGDVWVCRAMLRGTVPVLAVLSASPHPGPRDRGISSFGASPRAGVPVSRAVCV